jgi:hypothetical protein
LGGRQLHACRQHPHPRLSTSKHAVFIVETLDPCDRKAATHELNQDVGRDTLGRKDGLRAAVRVGNDELERTVAGGLRAAAWAQTVVRQLG